MESLPQTNMPETQPRSRFQTALELIIKPVVKKPELEGLDHLREIDPNQRVIFATSHLSDTDPIIAAAVLSKYRQLDIASLQTNQEAFALPLKVIGSGRFHDVRNTFDKKKMRPHTSFDGENYGEMKRAMEDGRDILIAAHKPSRDWHLPDKAGVGAVYLYQLTLGRAPIVPVAVDIHSETPAGMADELGKTIRRALSGRRPGVTVRIGSPIRFDFMSLDVLLGVEDLMMGRRDKLRKDGPRYQRVLRNYNLLKEDGEIVLSAISDLLPPEKRRAAI